MTKTAPSNRTLHKTYYLLSRDDDRAVAIFEDGRTAVVRGPFSMAIEVPCDLSTLVLTNAANVAAAAGFTVRNDKMMARYL